MKPFRVVIDTSQAVALAEAWRSAPTLARDALLAAVTEAGLLLEREVKERTPVGVGGGAAGLKGSIFAREPQVLADQVIGVVGTSSPHALPVEFGSKPHFPPIQPLADWARIKLGVPAKEARSVGFAIARKIARQGTPARFMFSFTAIAARAQIARIFDRAIRGLVTRLAEERGR